MYQSRYSRLAHATAAAPISPIDVELCLSLSMVTAVRGNNHAVISLVVYIICKSLLFNALFGFGRGSESGKCRARDALFDVCSFTD